MISYRLTPRSPCDILALYFTDMTMRKYLCSLLLLTGMTLLMPAPALAKDEEDNDKKRNAKKEKFVPKANLAPAYKAEIAALTEAETMLKTISDAQSAKNVKAKLMHKFSLLRPIVGGTEAQMEELAAAQNRVSAVMWDLMKEPYFEEVNLQELWTVMTHHFARRSANLLR